MRLGRDVLDEVLSVCFAASLSFEEGRGVRFRLLLADPESLPATGEPHTGGWILRFETSRPMTAHELMRLSPAVPFERALIGAFPEGGTLRIWGLAQTGAAWLAPSWGGRSAPQNRWTDAPIVHVSAPGRIRVLIEDRFVAGLERGQLVTDTLDVFASSWLPALFAEVRDDLRKGHAGIDDSLVRVVSQHMVRRVISLVRGRGHGGLILVLGLGDAEPAGPRTLRLKYLFQDNEPRRRYRTLMQRLIAEVIHLHPAEGEPAGWHQFERATTPSLRAVEDSIFEMSELLAALAAVDGAVVLDKRFALVGFGAEVSAELPSPKLVWRALDVEGKERACDPAESVGTRHRAAYRFIQHHPDGLAIVVSHDGSVRFVAATPDGVTYWEQFVNP